MLRIFMLLMGAIALMVSVYVYFEKELLAVAGVFFKAMFSSGFWAKALLVTRAWLGKMSLRFIFVELPKKLLLPLLFIFGFSSKNRKFLRAKIASLKNTGVAIKEFLVSRLEKVFGRRTSLAIALVISLLVFGVFFFSFGVYMIIWTGKVAVPGFVSTLWRTAASFVLSLLQRIGFKTTVFVSFGTVWKKWIEPLFPKPSHWWKRMKYRSARFAIKHRLILGRRAKVVRERLKERRVNRKNDPTLRRGEKPKKVTIVPVRDWALVVKLSRSKDTYTKIEFDRRKPRSTLRQLKARENNRSCSLNHRHR